MTDESTGVLELVLHKKPAAIILSLRGSKEKYASILSKETDCTYTHTLKILEELRGYGIVDFKKEGRTKKVLLTDVGEDVAHELEGLVRHLERVSVEKTKKTGNGGLEEHSTEMD